MGSEEKGNHLHSESTCQSPGIITSTYTICWVQLQINCFVSSFTTTHKNIAPGSWVDYREITFITGIKGPLVPTHTVATLCEPRQCVDQVKDNKMPSVLR